MKAVIDTNVLMAGLLSDSVVRRLLVSGRISFYLPDFAFEEIEKYKSEIKARAGCGEEEFQELMSFILKGITIVPKKEIAKHMREAAAIMEKIDKKDAPFLACAIAIGADGILSFDKDFSRQKRIRHFGIKDVLQ